jgi:hypothetical protein
VPRAVPAVQQQKTLLLQTETHFQAGLGATVGRVTLLVVAGVQRVARWVLVARVQWVPALRILAVVAVVVQVGRVVYLALHQVVAVVVVVQVGRVVMVMPVMAVVVAVQVVLALLAMSVVAAV